tara:strand:- start:240 stop:677 length:438 start_codon:yes stop_codon:yes gene_type:complete
MSKFIILVSILLLSSLTSCRKTGCTDEDSVHFKKDIKSDNSQCLYEGSLVFWYNKEVSDFLQENDVYKLNFYLDNEIIGSLSTEKYRETEPDCNDYLDAVKTTKKMGDSKTLEYQFSVKTLDSIEIWRTSIIVNANTCSTLQLGL